MIASLLLSLIFNLTALSQGTSYLIQGRIIDNQQHPFRDLRVLLMNENNFVIASVYTDVNGRYKFPNQPAGVYYVQVETGGSVSGSDYESQTRRVEVRSLTERRTGFEVVYQDFTLLPKKGKGNINVPGGTVFAQDVPEKAQAEYRKGMEVLNSNKIEEGIAAFNRALEIFPDYFQALEILGTAEVNRGNYEPAVKPLLHAIEINPKAALCYYSLGLAQLKLKKLNEATDSLRKSAALNGSMPNTQLMLGYALISNRQFAEAEAPLKLAYQLGGAKVIDAQQYLAVIYDKLGRYKEAAAALEIYIKEAPKDVDKEKFKMLVERLKEKAKAEKK